MPARIDADVDMKILADLGLGLRNKDIADNYGVSASYVSKLKQGHKIPNVYVANAIPETLTEPQRKEMIKYLEYLIDDETVKLNIHRQMLQYLKGGYYAKEEGLDSESDQE